MGAYKEKTGKTRVGAFLASIGSIFKKKTTTTAPTGATQPINSNTSVSTTTTTKQKTVMGAALASLGVALGNTALAWIGQQLPDPNANGLTTDEQAQVQADNQQQAQSTGNGVLFIIVAAVISITAFFYFKNKK